MQNETEIKLTLFDKTAQIIKNNKKKFISFLFFIIIVLIGLSYYNYYKIRTHEQISAKYIKAGIFLASGEKEKSKKIYKEIILSKNKFYSLLSLNNVLDNNLEENTDEVLNLFKSIEDIKIDKEEKNLIKFKKALYLIKISKETEGKKLLQQIISSNSIWKEAALEISK